MATPQQKIITAAEQKAKNLGHNVIVFDHIFSALLDDKNALEILSADDKIKLDMIRDVLAKHLKDPKYSSELRSEGVMSGQFVQHPDLEAALVRADREAENIASRYPGSTADDFYSQALLLALMADPHKNEVLLTIRLMHGKQDPIQTIRDLIDVAAAKKFNNPNAPAIRRSPSNSGPVKPWMPYTTGKSERELKDSVLNQFTKDLTLMAKNNKLDPVIGREDEVLKIEQILSRRQKNNPVLVGEPGVGKTAIVEGLAQRIVRGDVPPKLQGKTILSIDLGLVVAGTKYRGQFEERMDGIVKELTANPDIIVFIDEIHTMIGAGAAEGSMDAANILKPALSRGQIKVIGSTTSSEYKKSIMKDRALQRRFEKVTVEEPARAEAKQILEGLQGKYASYHGVTYSPEAIEAALELSTKYMNEDNSQPDKAITVLDDAGVTASFAGSGIVLIEHVTEVISKRTGIPVGNLTQDDIKSVSALNGQLKSVVFHQDPAINQVTKAIARSRAGMADPKRPIGSFLFVGPTGVGKTEVARNVAKFQFGDEKKMVRFDMSEFMEKHSISKLIGSPPGYVGYEEGGLLTDKIYDNPYSVVLFDEIEKAHPDIFNILLQVFEDGRLTDGKGRTVDFKNTILIMTSNAGANREIVPTVFTGKNKEIDGTDAETMRILKKSGFKPEFLNRLDGIVKFQSLQEEDMRPIIEKCIGEVKKRDGARSLSFNIAADVVPWLQHAGYDKDFGARPYKRLVDKLIADPITDAILDGSVEQGVAMVADIKVNADKSGLSVSFNKTSPASVALPAATNDNNQEASSATVLKPAIG